MSPRDQAYYELKFELAFHKAKGNEFQSFFNELMGRAYSGDFMPCRPWGKQGDLKNDGFLKSERRLFQVYAPNEMKATEAKAKIRQDFEGAKKHWGKYFDKWVFAHNATDGLPPHVQLLILEFEKKNPLIKLESWGLEEFRLVFRKLTHPDLSSWFGEAPSDETTVRLNFEDLRVVLEAISIQQQVEDYSVQVVPPGKIEANALSVPIATFLNLGRSKAPLVDSFFNEYHDPQFGERIANAFREKYRELRVKRLTPNTIFFELVNWAGGNPRGTSEHELAVYAVLAYFFDACDIFEAPRVQPP